MNYGYTDLATDWNEKEMNSIAIRLIRTFLFFIPKANRDNEKLYPSVKKWFIEIDDQGLANREIGLDKNDVPILSAPNERNFGLWTDCDNVFKVKDLDISTKEKFEEMWLQVEKNT